MPTVTSLEALERAAAEFEIGDTRPGRCFGACDSRGPGRSSRRATTIRWTRTRCRPRTAGAQKIGRTLCVNPGSDYSSGVLRGAVIDIAQDGSCLDFLLTTG